MGKKTSEISKVIYNMDYFSRLIIVLSILLIFRSIPPILYILLLQGIDESFVIGRVARNFPKKWSKFSSKARAST